MGFFLSILTNPVFIQAALAILGAVAAKSAQNSQLRKTFLSLVEDLYSEKMIPNTLREKYAAQVDENAKKAAEQWAREHPNG